MTLHPRHFTVLLSLCGALACAGAETRVWTNDSGATMEGELIQAGETEIRLKLKNGQVESIPRRILSAEDERYVAEWQAKEGNENAVEDALDEHQGGQEAPRPSGTWDNPWPASVGCRPFVVKTVVENNSQGLYQTDHFIIESPVPMLPEELTVLTTELETCLSALAALPLNLHLAAQPRNKCRIRIYMDEGSYEKAGGAKGTRLTAGTTYIAVLMQRNAKGKPVNLSKINAMHELTHWVTQFAGTGFWLNEGLARYMELTERKKGRVVFSNDLNRVALKVPRIYRRGWELLPPLDQVIGTGAVGDSERMNAAVLAVATYFIRFDGNGDAARLKAYMKAVQEGKTDSGDLESILLDGRTREELERAIRESWKKYMTPGFEAPKG